jgi:hypothetical protein
MNEVVSFAGTFTDKDNLRSAAQQLASPSMVNATAALAKTDPKSADRIGSSQNDLSTRALIRQVQQTKFGDIQPPQSFDQARGLHDVESVSFSLVFNPGTGVFEVESSGTDGVPKGYQKEADVINGMLQSSLSTKDYGGKGIKKLTESQYGQALANMMGVENKTGTNQIPYDKKDASTLVVGTPTGVTQAAGVVTYNPDTGAPITPQNATWEESPKIISQLSPQVVQGLATQAQKSYAPSLSAYPGFLNAIVYRESRDGTLEKSGQDRAGNFGAGLTQVEQALASMYPNLNRFDEKDNLQIAARTMESNLETLRKRGVEEGNLVASLALAHNRGLDSAYVKYYPDWEKIREKIVGEKTGDELSEATRKYGISRSYVQEVETYMRKYSERLAAAEAMSPPAGQPWLRK